MLKKTYWIMVIYSLAHIPTLRAQSFEGVRALAGRQFPWLSDRVTFKGLSPAGESRDSFRIYSEGNGITIEATSISTATAALNYYLKEVCHQSISQGGRQLKALKTLPVFKDTIEKSTPFQYRYALNYCTYNYSYSFYDWKDWEKELDWMALQGVNLMLAQMGTEEVWQAVLSQLGYSDAEIKAFIPGPAFNAWWLMGNMEGWGGPVSDAQIRKWTSLQQKVLSRMKELGIEPVIQGFYGMVPSNLKSKYPDAHIIDQGTWVGGFQRPAILLPQDPLFARMAQLYYGKVEELYGKGAKFLGGDLFHEGGKSNGLDISAVARGVQESMQLHVPGSTWVLQGWSGNPKKELLDGLTPSKTLVIDLFGESSRNWQRTKEYHGFPWIWASINNFGGKIGMGAQLPKIVSEPHMAWSMTKSNCMKGIGIIPEGIRNNPVVYDLALAAAWEKADKPVGEYLRSYITARYGKFDGNMWQGWSKLLSSLYGNYSQSGEGGFESVFCARPNMAVTSASSWGPKEMQYDPALPVQALKCFLKAAKEFEKTETYQYDVVDLARQVLADYARAVYKTSIAAFKSKDLEKLEQSSALFLTMLKQQDRLLQAHPDFMLGTWLQKAIDYGDGDAERIKLNVMNAKMQIAIWGPSDNPKTSLRDYANKEWAGMLADFYLPRWELFYADLMSQLNGNPPRQINYFEMEKKWAESEKRYTVKPTGKYLKEVHAVLRTIENNL